MATATITADQNTIVAEIFIAAPPAAAHADGWKRILQWLEAYAERGDTVDTRK